MKYCSFFFLCFLIASGIEATAEHGDKIIMVRNQSRNIEEFRVFAEQAARLKPYGEVQIEVSALADKSWYEIPEGGKTSKGRAIQNLINIEQDDKVKAYLVTEDLKNEEYVNSHYVIMATKNGQVKKTSLEQYSRPRTNGKHRACTHPPRRTGHGRRCMGPYAQR